MVLYMQDKYADDFLATVVIDSGSHVIRAGFGGDDNPRVVFGSVIGITNLREPCVGIEAKLLRALI